MYKLRSVVYLPPMVSLGVSDQRLSSFCYCGTIKSELTTAAPESSCFLKNKNIFIKTSPTEADALKLLGSTQARVDQQIIDGVPLSSWDIDTLTADSDAPDSTSPARTIYSRFVAASGSIALYELLCNIASTLGCTVEVIPGGVKELARLVFKSVLNYGGDFGRCRDATRATMEVGSIKDVVTVVNALLSSSAIHVIRIKDRFQKLYDSRPIGDYRDFQALCIFRHRGRWVFGEVQVNLAALVVIKNRPSGGHAIFKYARSIAAYTKTTYSWTGGASVEMCHGIENGMLVDIDLRGDQTLCSDAGLVTLFARALASPKCRVGKLKWVYARLAMKL